MADLNCHLVSRFLTRPWEHGQRNLSYFDFRDGRVRTGSSKTLFAEVGANTQDVEARLNAIIETPNAAAMTRLADIAPGDAQQALEWPLFRALSLLRTLLSQV